jgi:hypothetical protein
VSWVLGIHKLVNGIRGGFLYKTGRTAHGSGRAVDGNYFSKSEIRNPKSAMERVFS